MTWTIYDDMNPDYALGLEDEPRWEPWVDDLDNDQLDGVGCEFCGSPEVREYSEPFTGKVCCDPCFNMIIGDDPDALPWRCGNAP